MMGDMATLVLWDVDHTLIENGGVSKKNYALAFELLTGRPPAIQPQTDGRTDIGIMENLLSANHENPADFARDRQWAALTEAGQRNREELAARGRVLPGAAVVLETLAKDGSVVQTVLTGNIEANARIKLATFGLDRWLDFSVGAFGCERAVRSDLVSVAQRKAAQRNRFDAGSDVTVVVGDTELDVQAGRDGGARVIAVATGVSTVEGLQGAGADVVLPDLKDMRAFTAALATVRRLGPASPRQSVST